MAEEDDQVADMGHQTPASPQSPVFSRRRSSARSLDQRIRADEDTSLLDNPDPLPLRSYRSINPTVPGTPRLQRQLSYSTNTRLSKSATSKNPFAFSQRLVNALGAATRASNAMDSSAITSRRSFYLNDRVWYDQFTSTDWVHDNIADAFRVKALRSRKGLRGKLYRLFDATQGWVLVAVIGCITALVAYFVNVTEGVLFDYKFGYCKTAWYLSKKKCCSGVSGCDEWLAWSQAIRSDRFDEEWIDYLAFIVAVSALACLAFMMTSLTKTVIPSVISISTLDEDLAAEDRTDANGIAKPNDSEYVTVSQLRPPMVFYSAAGSGVAEIRVIVSGFVLHGYLGLKTLVIKTIALILSVASGLSVGKEGPFVHIATCVGNICCRLFPKYSQNDMKRREALSAAAASGVAVAFGAPIAGVLFSLEEVSYYFPPKTLFRTFFCCIVAALSLKFLNPYGTNKIVLFEVRYVADWKFLEMIAFFLLGVLGGALGALFIKATRIWALTFRRIPLFKNNPVLEVLLVALITGIISFWNRYTRIPVTELLFEIASPCDTYVDSGFSLCPNREQIPNIIWYLAVAFVIKAFLTTITFGIKVPAGIYVPSMVVGGLLGRMIGHLIQYLALTYPDVGILGNCDPNGPPEDCVVPGVYAMVAAGATMCGVTRLSVTLAVILFELTGSLDHVLPFSIGVLVSKWTADWIEPRSIYDLLTDMNAYPFLDNRHRPTFTSELGELLPRREPRKDRLIDISASPLLPATELREKLQDLHEAGELDGGLPIIKDGVLVGLIPAPDLEFALDRLENEENSLCLMAATDLAFHEADSEEESGEVYTLLGRSLRGRTGSINVDPTDFTPFIDPSPVALDVHSPMDLVYECFVKLGLRYMCVLRDGKFLGMLHKKAFVKYCKDLEKHHST